MVLVVAEVACYFGGKRLTPLFYVPPSGDFEAYRDCFLSSPNLGWEVLPAYSQLWDDIGSRITPLFPKAEESVPLVSLYGDSWTFGLSANHDEAPGNVLSSLLDRRVNNFGVPGYGTGQAYLRFKQNKHDDAKIVVLGHLSENILRNVNQFRGLLFPGDGLLFSPRFMVAEGGELQVVPAPKFSGAEYLDCLRFPEKHLEHEYFLPGGQAGIVRHKFPYTIALARLFWNYRLRAILRGVPVWDDFYRSDHAAKGLQVTVAIIRAFWHDAEKAGKLPTVVIFPTGEDLALYQREKRWTYQPLIDQLSAAGIPSHNSGDFILQVLGQRSPKLLFAEHSLLQHPNGEGYRLMAQGVYRHLVERGLLRSPQENRTRGRGPGSEGSPQPAHDRSPNEAP